MQRKFTTQINEDSYAGVMDGAEARMMEGSNASISSTSHTEDA